MKLFNIKRKVYYLVQLMYFALLVVIFVQCNGLDNNLDNKQVNNQEYFLEESDETISFTLNDNTPNRTKSLYFYQDSVDEYLTFLNQNLNSIQFYSFKTMNLEFEIKMPVEGDKGIGNIKGFYIKSLDSIYLTPSYGKPMVLINKKGDILKKIHYRKTTNKEPTGFYYSTTTVGNYHPLICLNQKLYLAQFPMNVSRYRATSESLKKAKICLEINLKNDSIKYLPMTVPLDYIDNGHFDFYFSQIYALDKFVYSFLCDHQVYYTDNHKEIKSKIVKSRYIDKFLPLPRNTLKGEDIFRHKVNSPLYLKIIYDKYRNVYYRYAYAGYDYNKNSGGNIRQFLTNFYTFSIIILDSNFNILGETQLPPKTYIPHMEFITEKGLYISVNNEFNENISEDQLAFRLLKLKKTDE